MERERLNLMELLRSNNRIAKFFSFRLIAATILFFIVVGIVTLDLVITGPARSAPESVRDPLKAVLRAKFYSSYLGGYWENDFVLQVPKIKKLPLEERLEFYAAVLVYCDPQDSKIYPVIDAIDRDARPLKDHLQKFRTSDTFRLLSTATRESVDEWIIQLDIVASQASFPQAGVKSDKRTQADA